MTDYTTNYALPYPLGEDRVAVAADVKALAQKTALELGGVEDKVKRRIIPDGANLDDYRTEALKGKWQVTSGVRSETMTGAKPFGDYPFMMDVKYLNSAAWQIAYPGGSGSYTEVKIRKYSPLSPGIGWTAWENLGDLWAKDHYSGSLDDLKSPGLYPIAGNTAGAPTTDAANVWVTPNIPAGNWRQELTTRTAVPRKFIRVTALSGWNPWAEQTNANEYNDPTYGYHSRDRRDKIVEKAARRVGKRVGTGGKSAVAITYDHGFANFRDKVLPLHRELGLPCTVAVNTATLGANDNLGVSYPELQDWALNDGVEIANHSRDHNDATTKAGIADKILGSLVLMHENMPLVTIDSYIMPGVGGTAYDGFNGGPTDESFYDKEAGRIILDNHGVVTGLIPGYLQPLTGTPNFGAERTNLDSASFVTEAQNKIAEAVERGGMGIIVYLHPIYLDQVDRTTTARLQSFLEFVAGHRDAGDLDVLSLTAFGFADAGHAGRHDLARPTQWVGGSQTVDLTNEAWVKGSVREFAVEVDSAATVTLTATDDTLALNAARTVTTTGPGTVRLHFTVPTTASTLTVDSTTDVGALAGHRVVAV